MAPEELTVIEKCLKSLEEIQTLLADGCDESKKSSVSATYFSANKELNAVLGSLKQTADLWDMIEKKAMPVVREKIDTIHAALHEVMLEQSKTYSSSGPFPPGEAYTVLREQKDKTEQMVAEMKQLQVYVNGIRKAMKGV